ncbi:MAG: cysteine desulfurase [Alphaproteobacteria bacterium]|nr:cysteine desulfurase [Alphaproteobacteria bacterium]
MSAGASPRIYLDHNATSPLRPSARAAMIEALDATGNPSSVHFEGRRAREIVEKARRHVAELVGARPRNVVFTSGATEANNAIIAQSRWAAVAVSAVEHPSVIEPARRLGADRFTALPVRSNGRIDLDALRTWLQMGGERERLVSVQWANGETGIVQPIHDVAELVAGHGALLHVDAVQAAGRIAIDVGGKAIAFLTVSSHKIGGPQGVGAIIQGPGGELRWPLVVGGGQESRLRAGTENVAGIAGFGAAATCALSESGEGGMETLRDRLEMGVKALTPDAVVIGEGSPRLANTSSIALAGVRAETSVIAFDLAGIAVSAGSACSSGKVGRSHVLTAMGLEDGLALSALRFSLGWSSTEKDVSQFLMTWGDVMNRKRAGVAEAAA